MSVADEKRAVLEWLSPLEPREKHQAIWQASARWLGWSTGFLQTSLLGGAGVVMKVSSFPCFVMGILALKDLSQVWIAATLRECGEAK